MKFKNYLLVAFIMFILTGCSSIKAYEMSNEPRDYGNYHEYEECHKNDNHHHYYDDDYCYEHQTNYEHCHRNHVRRHHRRQNCHN